MRRSITINRQAVALVAITAGSILLLTLLLNLLGWDKAFGILVFDDHPCKIFQLWLTLNKSIPESFRLFDWNPYWYAGFPEMQFWPGGYIIIGLIIKAASWGLASIEQIYSYLVILSALLLSGTAFLFLKKLQLKPAAVTLGVILAGTLNYGTSSLHKLLVNGMVPSRLAFCLVPLSFYLAVCLVEKPTVRSGIRLGFVQGLILLIHPYHYYSPFVFLAVLIIFSARSGADLWEMIRVSAIACGQSIGCAAFWIIPGFLKRSYTVPFLWEVPSNFMEAVFSGFIHPLFIAYSVFFLMAIGLGIWNWKNLSISHKSMICLPAAILMAVFADYYILIGHWGFSFFDPLRLLDDLSLSVALLSAVGFHLLFSRLKSVNLPFRKEIITVIAAICCILVAAKNLKATTSTLWDNRQVMNLDLIRKKYKIQQLWDFLDREDEGRVYFTASEFWFPDHPLVRSHVYALTPIFTGRSIVGGTYTHPSPIANLVYYGKTFDGVLHHLVEDLDGKIAFGKRWNDLEQTEVYNYLNTLNITTIVVQMIEKRVISFFEKGDKFRLVKEIGQFLVYKPQGYNSSFFRYDRKQMDISLDSFKRREFTINVHNSSLENNPLLIKSYYYPLWQASIDGKPLLTERGISNMTHLKLPAGKDYQVHFKYVEGWSENLGLLLSALLWALSIFTFLTITTATLSEKKQNLGGNLSE